MYTFLVAGDGKAVIIQANNRQLAKSKGCGILGIRYNQITLIGTKPNNQWLPPTDVEASQGWYLLPR